MINEKRNTAIMDKVERYTQHHTATRNLAQEAIERIAMTNDKDSAVLDPCPFCATAPAHFENAYGTGYIIHCPDDDCMVGPYVEMGTKEQSIAAWNTRQLTQSNTLKAAAEAIRGLLDITSEYNLDSEQAGRAYAALHEIGTALKEKSK
jgi:hypothetical protein